MTLARIRGYGGPDDDMNLVIVAKEEKPLKDYVPSGWSFSSPRLEHYSPDEISLRAGRYVVSGKCFGIMYSPRKIVCLGEGFYSEDTAWQNRMLTLVQVARANIDPSRNSDNEDVRKYLSEHRYPQEPQRVLQMLNELCTFDRASVNYAQKLRNDLEQEGFTLTLGVPEPNVQHLLEDVIDDRAVRYFGILRGFDLLQSNLAHRIIDKVGLQQVWG